MQFFSALSHLLIPKTSNRNRAKLLHWEIVVALAAIVFFGNKFAIGRSPQILGFANQISVSEVIRLTNVKRVEAGLTPVSENSLLDNAAKQKGIDMLNKGYWAHVAPDGTQPWDFFKNVNYKYKYAGENLARDFNSASSTVDAWMASSSHRENILNSKYRDIGVAVVDGSLAGKDATIVVQLFGSKASDIPALPLAQAKENQTASVAAIQKEQEEVKNQEIASLANVSVPPPQAATKASFFPTNFDISKVISGSVVGILLLVMLVDAALIWKNNTQRKASRSVAQITFLGMIFAIIIIAKAGEII